MRGSKIQGFYNLLAMNSNICIVRKTCLKKKSVFRGGPTYSTLENRVFSVVLIDKKISVTAHGPTLDSLRISTYSIIACLKQMGTANRLRQNDIGRIGTIIG